VDDPYKFGQIAAANSLSDVYAMGGQPIIALNIVCFPDCLDPSVLSEIMRGGADKVKEAGAVLVGGHSVSDEEPKYWLSVTGTIHPDEIYANSGSKPGDVLVLTKPLGLGILNTAIKAELATEKQIDNAVDVMITLNNVAADGMKLVNTNACTDITGFGMAGHVCEVAKGSNVTIELDSKLINIIDGTIEHAQMGLVPAGMYNNRKHFELDVKIEDGIDETLLDILYDPQTSGGLLVSVPEEEVETLLEYYEKHLKLPFGIVGRVLERQEKALIIK
jgi:selenide,water dikinase